MAFSQFRKSVLIKANQVCMQPYQIQKAHPAHDLHCTASRLQAKERKHCVLERVIVITDDGRHACKASLPKRCQCQWLLRSKVPSCPCCLGDCPKPATNEQHEVIFPINAILFGYLLGIFAHCEGIATRRQISSKGHSDKRSGPCKRALAAAFLRCAIKVSLQSVFDLLEATAAFLTSTIKVSLQIVKFLEDWIFSIAPPQRLWSCDEANQCLSHQNGGEESKSDGWNPEMLPVFLFMCRHVRDLWYIGEEDAGNIHCAWPQWLEISMPNLCEVGFGDSQNVGNAAHNPPHGRDWRTFKVKDPCFGAKSLSVSVDPTCQVDTFIPWSWCAVILISLGSWS